MTETATVYQISERRPAVKADTDDGWYKIANALSLQLCRTKLNEREGKIVHAVMHKTFGYKKSLDWISLEQLSELTEIQVSHISEVKKSLIDRQILIADGRKIGINTVVSEWVSDGRPNTKPHTKNPNGGNNAITLTGVTDYPNGDIHYPNGGKQLPQRGGYNKKDNTTKERKRKSLVGQPDDAPVFDRVISHLNAATGKKFKNTKSHQKFIGARLAEGHSESDLITVIDRKVIEWLDDPRMNEYLRPSTLFNSEKFDGYLNSTAVPTRQRKPGVFIPDNHSTAWADGFDPFAPETFS